MCRTKQLKTPKQLSQTEFERAKARELTRLSIAFKRRRKQIINAYTKRYKTIKNKAKKEGVSNAKLCSMLRELRNQRTVLLRELNIQYDKASKLINSLTHSKYITNFEKVKNSVAKLTKEMKSKKVKSSDFE